MTWALVLLLVYAAWLTLLYFVQGSVLYMNRFAGGGVGEALIPAGVERLWIEPTPGTRVEAWLFRHPDASTDSPRPLVVMTHGNAELIDDCQGEAAQWLARGFNVLLPEYRSYGRSGGTPSQRAIVADAVQFIDAAGERNGVDAARPVLHGRSLGTGVAAQVALQRPPRLMVLESPFTSVASFSWRYGAPPWLVTNPYRTDKALPQIDSPVLILAATGDEIVPVTHARSLAKAAPRVTLVELDGSHNSGLSMQRAYWAAVDGMLTREGVVAVTPGR